MTHPTGFAGTAPGATPRRPSTWRSVVVAFFKVVLALVILGLGCLGAARMIETAPKADRKKPARQARLVEVEETSRITTRTQIDAMGTILPVRQIALKPQVSGQIVEVSEELQPGGRFQQDETILRIDPRDYELVVRQSQSSIKNSERDLKIERGNQSVAKREYELLGEVVSEKNRELVLREPQLASAETSLMAAQAALEKAQLDLERTRVRAPFNAMVQSKDIDKGAIASPATQLATLVGTDEYWVEGVVAVDQLQWIEVPSDSNTTGSLVRIYNAAAWGDGVHRIGTVSRLIGDLEKEGRMARLLVTVRDPLALEARNAGLPVLLIGSYVRLEIEGKPLSDVVPVPRDALREGNLVWLMSEQGTLDVRPVEVAYRGREQVFVASGLAPGEKMIRTNLAAPVAGMPLRTAGNGELKSSEDGFALESDSPSSSTAASNASREASGK